MSLGNVPSEKLVSVVEKLLAKMDESDLAAYYERELSTMPKEASGAFVEALFEAFRERGESSEDAAEGAGTTLDGIERNDASAINALLAYGRGSPDLLKEATAIFVEQRPDLVESLPAMLRTALAERLS